jgi:hypothetical protein
MPGGTEWFIWGASPWHAKTPGVATLDVRAWSAVSEMAQFRIAYTSTLHPFVHALPTRTGPDGSVVDGAGYALKSQPIYQSLWVGRQSLFADPVLHCPSRQKIKDRSLAIEAFGVCYGVNSWLRSLKVWTMKMFEISKTRPVNLF